MPDFYLTSFLGGVNQQFDPTKIAENEYPLMINGRVRSDEVETIQLPSEITQGLPEAINFQGIYSVGLYLLAIIDGEAYYRSFDPNNPSESFAKVSGLLLDASVDRVYCELIPGSSINFKRKADAENNYNGTVTLFNVITGSPDCAFLTDGINQAKIIFPDGSSRTTQNWTQWVDTTRGEFREYVPIGTFPLYYNGNLYLAGKDQLTGRLNRILRSVTGRPLDFMVLVDTNGNKLSTEQDGSADVVAHRIDYNTITGLSKISLIENPQNTANTLPPFLVSTAYSSYLVTPRLDSLILEEPTFSNRFLFSTGMLNPFCVIDEISGDTLMIDSKGIISFNAALAAKSEGRNLPFSRRIYRLFEGITQTVACCAKVENYIYFGVNTVYGPAVVVYDETLRQWVSIDIYPGINLVKQFAVISTTNTKRLFFITIDNKLYEAYASPTTATCRVYTRELTKENKHLRVLNVEAVVKDIYTGGQVLATLFSDGKKYKTNILNVNANKETAAIPIPIPFGRSDEDSIEHLSFGFPDAPQGFKNGLLLEWNAKATLNSIKLVSNEYDPIVDAKQESSIEQLKTTLVSTTSIVFVGWAGLASSGLATLVRDIKEKNPNFIVLCGNNNQPSGALATLQANIADYWDKMVDLDRVFAALGPKDLDTLNGRAHLEYFNPIFRYYSQLISPNVELFILNSGFTSANVVIETDGNTLGSQQSIWLKQALANSTAKWKIVVVWDTPLFSNYFNDWPFRRWGASLVISAKHQNYERLYQDQFNQINVGSGSNNLESFTLPYSPYSQSRYNIGKGYLFVECNNINLNGTFIASPSKLVEDEFQILG